MEKFACLNKIRMPEKTDSTKKKIFVTIAVLLLGICLGSFSKFLDYRQAELPTLLQTIDSALDFHNFLGSFAPWIVIAVCIAVYSHTPVRAAINVFAFFSGMVTSYYLYSNFVAGFFPRSYALIWIAFTVVSPLLAFLTWYAKGKGLVAFTLSAGIIGVLINTAFAYGMFYVDVQSWLNVLMLLLGVAMLHKSWKETMGMIGAGIVLAIVIKIVIPFHIW